MTTENTHQAATAPEVTVANKIALTVQSTDFIIWTGTTRVLFNPSGTQAASAVEYSNGLSMSPIAAKQLHEMLSLTIEKYEETFGKIPTDPAMNKKLASMKNESLVSDQKVDKIKISAKSIAPKNKTIKNR